MNTRQGTIHLFRVVGIDVFLHWSWFVVAAFEISDRAKAYSSLSWNVLEYLALFVIVLLHEFGHALACRQVGGTSNRIMLWPFGGIAYVNPPRRPGATLWSIAAGPLVNVALLPVLLALTGFGHAPVWAATMPNVYLLLRSVLYIDIGLLIFNILPIYPLDGGQILRSLLWFVMGRARSLMVTTILGFAGIAGLVLLALRDQSLWLGAIALFMLTYCWKGLKGALVLYRIEQAPRRQEFACPDCKSAPPMGNYWRCSNCKQAFDTFHSQAVCPNCAKQFRETTCVECGRNFPFDQWTPNGSPMPEMVPESTVNQI